MQPRNIIFFYTESIDPEHEIKYAEKVCIEPEKTAIWKKMKAMFGQHSVYKIGWHCSVPELDINKDLVKEYIADIKAKYRGQDVGSCVLGMKLSYKKRLIVDQFAQGSVTNELYFDEVKKKLIEMLNFDSNSFVINYGRMD
jgi:hypothetical protein